LATLACLLLLARPGGAAEPGFGLVVESVAPLSASSLSGFQPGDLLLSWTFRPSDPAQGGPERGALATPFDLIELLIETAPRGELTFEGWREGEVFSWTYRSMGGLVLGLEARPAMDLDQWAHYQRALCEIGTAGFVEEPPPARPAGGSTPAAGPRLAAWYRLRWAATAASAGHTDAADREFREASEILLRAPDPSARAAVLWAWAGQLINRRDHARARELLEEALELVRRRDGFEYSVAFTLGYLAYVADVEGDLAASERIWLERLAVLEKLAPESMEAARTLDFLGYLALWRGDTAAAQERLVRSEAIQRPIASGTLHYAATLNKLALLAENLGDLERAEALQRQVLTLNEQLVPGSQDHGGSLMNLAMTLILRGEFALAEDLLRQSVELMGKPGKDPVGAAGPTANLGMLALQRGDLAAAQSYLELALSLLRNGPDGVELADVYSGLAVVARKQHRFAEARAWEKSALAIAERLALGGFGQAARLQALARIEQEGGGDLAAAERLLRQAEGLARAAAPESPRVNSILRDLGRLLARTGRLAEAESLYRQILSNLERRGFAGTKDEAEIFNLLGSVQRRRGNLDAAEESLCRATRILDLQRSRLGGSLESRSWFESETQSYSFDCLSALLELGRSAEAFHALERGKTQVFLQLLAERDLRLAGLPPELKAERARLGAEYDRVLSRLSGLGAEGAAEIPVLRARLEEIKAARESLIARLRLQSPRLAALQAPAPLDLEEARRALDPGTALLAYAVGAEGSYLFVVRPSGEGGSGLEVHRLPAGRAALEEEIETYRRLLANPRSHLATLNARAARLYALLVKPAENRLARARRILISADGPLHLLPWAALRRRDRYLAHWRPIHLIASTTVYAETRRGRQRAGDPATWRLVAFGDPRYPEVSGAVGETFADSEVRSVLRRGVKLEPLPAARDEVREIAKLFPGAEVYLGDEATEDRAKQAAPRADLLHFAGHGLVDERFPLDSALALTIPARLEEGRDNGLLQAWEIFEDVRLDAHLVTLSACETALGREMGGEGLLGLTRAFQFAGASTVLASLWNVSDASTTALMKRFYSYLRQGRTKDEALRAAQLDLIRYGKEGLAHPYHWAGFSLYGDWR
jgi:CHAT domain-containing protein/Flp pilus assembly protein TadD